MHPRTAPPDTAAPLCVEVLDDRGQVLDTVYVSEISGGPATPPDPSKRNEPDPSR
jgi:hypothetical protein